ncbi:leucine-rich repeat extensin-like protein 6 [Typha angustifolia]|uniref:leucine-rich repeat extensin-like protein 6 n=1 Tax=Typha angustifolia TaxID=59011 RepID=UPI003C2AD674
MEVTFSPGRRLLTFDHLPLHFHLGQYSKYNNPRLKQAYVALVAWKRAIISDPGNFTGNWVGPDVCSYNGVFCAPSLDDPLVQTVAGVDLNGADLDGCLPVELGLLTDLSILHLNSNRFVNALPKTISNLTLLHELDVSNNHLTGQFPTAVLALPSLKYLDLRFNHFEGPLPQELFDKDLDALFLNNNRFSSCLPTNFGNSPASVVVLANNLLEGDIPCAIGKMENTLKEIILSNNSFTGCLPREIGSLKRATVLDVSLNSLVGGLPKSLEGLLKVERLNLDSNEFTGLVPESVCQRKNLLNFSLAYNYFSGEEPGCKARSRVEFEDWGNCMVGKKRQRSALDCESVVNKPVYCGGHLKSRLVSTIAWPPSPASSPAPSVSKGY